MQSFSVVAILALAASLVSAAPSALEARTYPTVATYEAEMTEVDPAYLESLSTVVINLDEPAKRSIDARQSGTCFIQG